MLTLAYIWYTNGTPNRKLADRGCRVAQSLNKKELVRQKLREEIISGRLNPGDAIAERTVAEEFEVSRVPVREALIQLERDGLVEISPGRGAQVRRFNAGNIESLYHLREALEGMAARLAAARTRPMELATFRQKFQDISANPSRKDLVSISRLGDEFHSAVIYGSRNSMIIDISGSIADRVHLARRLSYGHADAASVGKATQEHLGIMEAICGGDPDLAERRMRSHISRWAQIVLEMMPGDVTNNAMRIEDATFEL
jgi:DNA-binding GntR family transcriptional regulator